MNRRLVFFLKEDLDGKQSAHMYVTYTATAGLKQGHRSRQTAVPASFTCGIAGWGSLKTSRSCSQNLHE